MTRINPVDRETGNDRLRQTFDAVQKQLGVVPNMVRTMAQSPAVLNAYLAFGAALHKGLLPAALQEQIALTVAEVNACDYCLSAHSALGRGAGLSSDEIVAVIAKDSVVAEVAVDIVVAGSAFQEIVAAAPDLLDRVV